MPNIVPGTTSNAPATAGPCLSVAIVIFYLFPVYWMVATSFKTDAGVYASPPQIVPIPPNFAAYQTAVLNNPLALHSIFNSAVVGTGTMLFTLVLAAPAAYALARLELRIGAFLMLLLLITQLLPGIVIATPLFVAFSKIGLLNSYPALILADTTFTLPFAVIVLRPFFLTIHASSKPPPRSTAATSSTRSGA